uniref:Transposase n=1 Tax=Ascaris lumbricoides TaxID=6252 RepID=A0A0M3IKX5_ASCLU
MIADGAVIRRPSISMDFIQIRGFDNTYVFRKDGHRHKRAADDLTRVLRSDYRVRRTAFLSESKPPQAPN